MRKRVIYTLAILVASLNVYWAYQAQREAEVHANALVVKQEALMKAQSEASTLRKVVVRQDGELLAARSVGLLDINPGPWRTVVATWYDGSDGLNGTGDGITYSGKHVIPKWVAAADPKLYPIGSIIQVKFANEVTQVYQVLDVGGAIHGNRLDIYDPSYTDCMKRGIQNAMVRVLVKGR